MDRFTSGLPNKGYNHDLGGRKRVQLPMEHSKGVSPGIPYSHTNPYHSTPKFKPTSLSTTVASSTFKPRTTSSSYYPPTSMATLRASRSKSPVRSTSPILGRSSSPSRRGGSPSRILNSSPLSPSKQVVDGDNDTVQRQRRELQLLIGELKDRDRELNDMVQAHQKQIVAWEDDRQRVFSLEKRCSRLESELKGKAEQVKSLHSRLKAAESEEQSKIKELEEAQVQLHQFSEQANTSLHQVQDLEEKNNSLTNTMRELSNTIGQLQAKEQELSTRLKLKDNDIMEANVRLGEMQQKIRRLEALCQDFKKEHSSLKNERDHWKDQALANKNEIEKLRGDISKQFSDADEIQSELGKTKQEMLALQKELFLSGEREKRKDQLLDLQKSKQERTDSELQSLRQICERQQRDISYMQMQLQNNHDMFKADSDADAGYQDKPMNGYYGDQTSYPPNSDFDNQDVVSTKSLDFDDNDDYSPSSYKPDRLLNLSVPNDYDDDFNTYLTGPTGETPAPNFAALGSDFGEDLESISQDTIPNVPQVTDRQFPMSSISEPFPSSRAQTFYDGPITKSDTYPPIAGLSLSGGVRPEADTSGSYLQYPSSVGMTRPVNGYNPYTTAVSQAPADDSSPTSKLHRLLAESRQMVQNLEQTSSLPITASPASQEPGSGHDQYTPPQRHHQSPLTSHALTSSAN
ncbi:coiled-coil domain-containing protein 62 isoform X3 [Nematostella vectensis]|uniref:coiled-coil domain-containing protein 62 isoform X3 n=1 Tax=Nematostella vectensis TaxID=45351 RepID=UPI0013902F6D|nr:coiled-coil domain-containing protein 62 isoform X3 [Nematostella vectensis]